jgi:enoyl-CoA hydratase
VSDTYETILTETRGRVLLITLNRPKALNALNAQLTREVIRAATEADADPGIGCIVLTGSAKAFAAGADIKEMQHATYAEMYSGDRFADWDRFVAVRKPIIAAVAGYALFGQPEIKLGVMPGIGGSQRLTRFVGKAKAMEMCLTGRMMDAAEAERAGLVSRVIAADQLLDEALKAAETIASMSLPIAMMTKEAVNRSYETTLTEGIRFERRVFHAMFATKDQKEGMAAFVEKRPPRFENT